MVDKNISVVAAVVAVEFGGDVVAVVAGVYIDHCDALDADSFD